MAGVIEDGSLEAASPHHGRRPVRVLLVDDNVYAVDCLAQILDLWGYETRAVSGGREAVELAREFQPHLVLIDIGLPDMDGYAVARALRNAPWFGPATLMAMSGHGRDHAPGGEDGAAFDGYLVKPLDLDALRQFLAGLEGARPCGEERPGP